MLNKSYQRLESAPVILLSPSPPFSITLHGLYKFRLTFPVSCRFIDFIFPAIYAGKINVREKFFLHSLAPGSLCHFMRHSVLLSLNCFGRAVVKTAFVRMEELADLCGVRVN